MIWKSLWKKCPSNADNRQAKISTILASGDKNIDLISVNDEMISEFKHKGYLEPLGKKRYDRRSKRQLSAEVSGKHL